MKPTLYDQGGDPQTYTQSATYLVKWALLRCPAVAAPGGGP